MPLNHPILVSMSVLRCISVIFSHEDGSVRFWDVSSCFLGPLYRLSLAALFGNVDDSEMEGPDESQEVDWPPFVKAGSFDQFCADQRLAVVKMSFCPLSRILAVGGYGGYVVLAMFNKHIQQSQMTVCCTVLAIGNYML